MCDGRLWAQPENEPAIFIVNPKGCLDPSPEAVELDSCPPGTPSPWTSCPTGSCTDGGGGGGMACVIEPNISFTNWDHYTNDSVFNPPEVGPGVTGQGALEVSRRLCSRKAGCPCLRLPDGTRACVVRVYVEEWLVQYALNPRLACVLDTAGGGGGSGPGSE